MSLLSCVKSFFLIAGTILLYKKLLSLPVPAKRSVPFDICYSLMLSFIIGATEYYLPTLRVAMIVIIISGFVMLHYKQPFKIAIVTTVISASLSYVAYVISGSLAYPVKQYIEQIAKNTTVSTLIALMWTGIWQLLLIRIPFSVRRLKKGMPFLRNKRFTDIGVVIGIIVICASAWGINRGSLPAYVGSVLVCGMLLFLWWYDQLKAMYQEKYRATREESLESEITRLQKEHEELVHKNYELSRIIHSDNKLLPALVMELKQILESSVFEDEQAERKVRDTVTYVESFDVIRRGVFTAYDTTHMNLVKTGVTAVDVIVRYMAQRAANQGARFNFTVMGSVKYLTDHIIPENDLSTLLADLLENALIAVKDTSQKDVLLSINIVENSYLLEVYDSGIAFQPDTIRHMGLERTTTHEANGGSGIGLMTAFEIIRACGASFILDETIDNELYTKGISIRFDNRSQTRIISNRTEVLNLSKDRTDIVFCQNESGK